MCSRKWLTLVLVACGLASACSDYNTNLSIQTSSSVLTFVSPSSATVGTQGFTITANGSGFVAGAIILWNATPLNTTLISSVQLTAPVPASFLTKPGTVQIAVQIPGSAQSATQNINNTTTTEVSDVVLFTIGTPPGTPPAITSVAASTTSVASTPACSAQGFTLTVNGTNFTNDAIVNWNGAAEPTTFVSATQLTAAIPATATALPGTAGVTVTNSVGTSPSSPVTLTTAGIPLTTPILTSLSQTTAGAGSAAVTLTVTGSGILPCSVVQWTSPSNVVTLLPTVFNSATQLTATVPPADFLTTGSAQVKILTQGAAGAGTSGQIGFTITGPTITALSSSTTSNGSTPSCGASDVILTVTGTNFASGSIVNWIVNPPPALPSTLSTTFVSPTQLTATIPAGLVATSGTVQIQVSNFGVLSNSTAFTVSPASLPAPTISGILPATATAGAAGATITVTGTNLVPCSVVQWTSGATTTQLPTTYVKATAGNPIELVATVPAADIASVGTAQITVASPASGGNVSGQVAFTIGLPTVTSLSSSTTKANNTPFCSQGGLTLTVNGTGFANGLTVNWNGSPRPTTFVSATQLTAAITAADTAFLAASPAAIAITVSGANPGTNSNALPFTVGALTAGTTLPAPVLSSISPTSAATEVQTGPAIALTLNGNNLSPCTVAQWNGNPLPTTIFIGSGGIASFIPAANLGTTGSNLITAVTPGPGASNSEPFSVFAPGSPTVTNVPGGSLALPVLSVSQRFGVYVLASSDGTTQTPGTTQNIFLKDTCVGVASGCTASTTLVSAASNGTTPGNADSIAPSVSANGAPSSPDGRYVAFLSAATNLAPAATNGLTQAFVRDTCAGVASGCTPSTQVASVSTGGTQANAAILSATVDATGRYVTFESSATNLGSTSSSSIGLFVRDTCINAPSGCTPTTQPLN
jgi:trimeric autotransporter adhesin